MTTKILALTDALGNRVRFRLMPGNRYDTVGVPPLLAGVSFGALIADLQPARRTLACASARRAVPRRTDLRPPRIKSGG